MSCAKSDKRDSIEANNLKDVLYLSVGAYVMLISNMWTEVGLHNGAKVTVVIFGYTDSEGPINGGVSETVVVNFRDLSKSTDNEPFLEGFEQGVVIPIKQVEYKHEHSTLLRGKFPLMLSWDFYFHKSQVLTSEMEIIESGNSKTCSSMILVALFL